MKMDFNKFFGKKGKIYLGAGALAVIVFVTAGGIYASNRANQTHQLAKIEQEQKQAEEKQKEDLAKKEREEKEKSELAKAEEQKAKEDEEKKKQEEVKKAEEEKKEQEQKQAEAKSEETKQSSNNNTKVVAKKETPKKNNSSNNNSNKKNNSNTFEVEEDENTYPPIGNSGMFFATQQEAWNYGSRMLQRKTPGNWKEKGYYRYWVGQCKHKGKIGWTVDFRK
ncbi:hypothetical protein [uncultured Parvimonas sp.]|uniref:hypothetical protein n=1 Tax=uncultured Parvimonas sp. TaxID=747372 RepID=UPI002592A548|nr:hypothetical protein [uncultured Parvimonas sp.]